MSLGIQAYYRRILRMALVRVCKLCALLQSADCVHCYSLQTVCIFTVCKLCALLQSADCVHCYSLQTVCIVTVCKLCALLQSADCVHCYSLQTVCILTVCRLCALLQSADCVHCYSLQTVCIVTGLRTGCYGLRYFVEIPFIFIEGCEFLRYSMCKSARIEILDCPARTLELTV